jgi:hypothetical protein
MHLANVDFGGSRDGYGRRHRRIGYGDDGPKRTDELPIPGCAVEQVQICRLNAGHAESCRNRGRIRGSVRLRRSDTKWSDPLITAQIDRDYYLIPFRPGLPPPLPPLLALPPGRGLPPGAPSRRCWRRTDVVRPVNAAAACCPPARRSERAWVLQILSMQPHGGASCMIAMPDICTGWCPRLKLCRATWRHSNTAVAAGRQIALAGVGTQLIVTATGQTVSRRAGTASIGL